MVQFGKFKPLLKLAITKLYDIFSISIKLGKGWRLTIDQNNVNPIHTWISTESLHTLQFAFIPCFKAVPIDQVNGRLEKFRFTCAPYNHYCSFFLSVILSIAFTLGHTYLYG